MENFKKCPGCGHKCFWKAKNCEKCLYDFITQKKLRAKRAKPEIVEEEEIEIEEVENKPKKCPLCSHLNFWKAKDCEKCKKWDFVKDSVKEQKEEVVEQEEESKVISLGLMPIFANYPKKPWWRYEGKNLADLRTWANSFLLSWEEILGEGVYKEVPYLFAQDNGFDKKDLESLEELYCYKNGTSRWVLENKDYWRVVKDKERI